MMIRFLIAGCLLILMPLNCTDLGPESDAGRIVWNTSIERILHGDDSLTVVRKLGPPNAITSGLLPGDAPVAFPGCTLHYTSGSHAGLMIVIWRQPSSSWGLGARYISAGPPYTGTTKEGIGLGSTREEVHRAFGPPTESGHSIDWYIGPVNRTMVAYNDSSRVTYIVLTDPEGQGVRTD
jgi:hypothetical protein